MEQSNQEGHEVTQAALWLFGSLVGFCSKPFDTDEIKLYESSVPEYLFSLIQTMVSESGTEC